MGEGSREAVVKVVSFGKSARAAQASTRYIAEGSEHVPAGTQLRDAQGVAYNPDQAAARMALVPDSENLSPAARALPEAVRRRMPEKDRLRQRQTCHLILSFPRGQRVDPQSADLIAQSFIGPWADQGHEAFYVPHLRSGEGRVSGPDHIHVVVAMASSDPGQRRLQMRKSDLAAMRTRFRDIAARYGIEMEATRRIDRPELQAELVAGAVPLRAPDRFEGKRRGRLPKPQLLERQSPLWYSRHGAAWEARRAGADTSQLPSPPPATLPRPPAQATAGLEAWTRARFTDDSQALAATRFLEMTAEAPRTAIWYANNRPEVFGTLAVDAAAIKLTGRQVPLPARWRQAAAEVLRSAESPHHRGRRLTRARELRAEGDRAVRARSAAFAAEWIRERRGLMEARVPQDLALELAAVPAWREHFGVPPTGNATTLPDQPALPKSTERAVDSWVKGQFDKGYRAVARERFLAMYAERPETATTIAAAYPDLFAPLRNGGRPAASLNAGKLKFSDETRAEIRAVMAAARRDAEPTARSQALAVLDDLVREETVVSDELLAKHLLERSGSLDAAQEALRSIAADPDVVTVDQDPATGVRQLSTRAVVSAEARLAETVTTMKGSRAGAVGRLTAGRTLRRFDREFHRRTGFRLTPEQKAAVLHATTGPQLAVVTGAAGAGKSTAFEAARHVWERGGRQVIGAAPSGIAAQALGETGIASTTLHRLEQRLAGEAAFAALHRKGVLDATARENLVHAARFAAEKQARPADRDRWNARAKAIEGVTRVSDLDRQTRSWVARQTERRLKDAVGTKSVIVIDEAGMIGHEQLDRVLHRLNQAGARVVLSGDPEQLQPIPAGAALRAVQKIAEPARLTEVRRQKIDWQQQASTKLSTGSRDDARAAFEAYGSQGHFRTGIEGYDLAAQVRDAEKAIGNKLSLHDQEMFRNVLDYAAARQVAGRAFAEKAMDRFAEATQARNDAALRIAEDLEAHRPWLDRLSVDGPELANRIAESRGLARDERDAAATKLVQAFELGRPDPDVRLTLDAAAGARAELLQDHRDALEADPERRRLILAYTNADVAKLNAGARASMREFGLLKGPDRSVENADGAVPIAKGDRILITSNLYGGHPRQLLASNGAIGTVTAIGEAKEGTPLSLQLDSGATVTIDSAFKGWQHGYAATVHKSQGATIDQVFVLDHRRFERHLATVAMTRHREDVQVYAAAVNAITPDGLVERWSEARSKTIVADRAAPAEVLRSQEDPIQRADALERQDKRLFPAAADPEVEGRTVAPAAPEPTQKPTPDQKSSPTLLQAVAARLQAHRDAATEKRELQEALQAATQQLASLEASVTAESQKARAATRVLPQIYQDPDKAGSRLQEALREKGLSAVVRVMETEPEQFGQLQGRGFGPLRSKARRAAGSAAEKAVPLIIESYDAWKKVEAESAARDSQAQAVAQARANLQAHRVPPAPSRNEMQAALQAAGRDELQSLPPETRNALEAATRRPEATQQARGRGGPSRGGRGR